VFSVEESVSPALVKLRLAVDEIFDQTPGPQAGSRL
jgi:ribosomal protein S11